MGLIISYFKSSSKSVPAAVTTLLDACHITQGQPEDADKDEDEEEEEEEEDEDMDEEEWEDEDEDEMSGHT